MPRDLDATIACERELMDCLLDAVDEQAEKGEEAWRTEQIRKLNQRLDAVRAERERRR